MKKKENREQERKANRIITLDGENSNRSFAASQSRGTKPPYWRAKVALGQDKQRKLPFKIMYAFCLSRPSATFAHQYSGFISREWPAAKGLLKRSNENMTLVSETSAPLNKKPTDSPQ